MQERQLLPRAGHFLSRWIEYKWLVAVVVSLATFVVTVDTMVFISLPALAQTFDVDVSIVVWVAISYFVVSVGLMFTMGWVSDGIGRNRALMYGLAFFTIATGLGAVSQNVYQLIAVRAISGVGAATIVSSSLAVLVAAFPRKERGLAVGLAGAAAGAGLMAGPLLGGLLLDSLGWQAIFWARVPLGLITLLLALSLLPWDRGVGIPKLDLGGALGLFFTLVSLLLAVNQAGRAGASHPLVFVFAGMAVMGLVFLIFAERGAQRPVLDFKLFRRQSYTVGMLSLVTLYIGDNTIKAIAPFMLISGLEFSASKAGLFIALYHGMRLPVSPPVGWLSDRVGTPVLMIAGIVILGSGLFTISNIDAGRSMWFIVAAFGLAGVGTAIFDPANGSSVMGAVPKDRLGTGSAAVATGRQIGLTVGAVLATAVFASRAAHYAGVSPDTPTEALPPVSVASGSGDAVLVASIVVFTGILVVLTRVIRRRQAVQHE